MLAHQLVGSVIGEITPSATVPWASMILESGMGWCHLNE